ncbi:MAG: hypothetical protein I8H94_00760 [Rhodobacteraceae bacterium]|nr:hypothetical protein [Paracoccaceae bacterium]
MTDQRISGSDIVLSFALPKGDPVRLMTVTLLHAQRPVFRVDRKVMGRGGTVEFRIPFPLWLADGMPHQFEVVWDRTHKQSIWIGAKRGEIDAHVPIMASWAMRAVSHDEVWIVDPPVRMERRRIGLNRQVAKSYLVRHRGRLVAQANGWIPSPMPQNDAILPYLSFSEDIRNGNGDHLLDFHDRETGVVELSLARSKLIATPVGDALPISHALSPLDNEWDEEWPLRIAAGKKMLLEHFVPLNSFLPNIQTPSKIERLLAVVQMHGKGSLLTLVFPPESPEEMVVRWSVFLNGVPQQARQNLNFGPEGVTSSHMIGLNDTDVVRLELRGYPDAGPLIKPSFLIVE